MKITFIGKEGEKTVEVPTSITLLEAIEQNDIPVIGACGGAGLCGSCRVQIAPPSSSLIPEPSDNELDTLEMFQSDDGVRLACQIKLTEACDGLRVTLL